MAEEQVIINGRTYSIEEYNQVQNLIFKGKAGILGQDPKLRSLTNFLVMRGYRSAESLDRARRTGDIVFLRTNQPLSPIPENQYKPQTKPYQYTPVRIPNQISRIQKRNYLEPTGIQQIDDTLNQRREELKKIGLKRRLTTAEFLESGLTTFAQRGTSSARSTLEIPSTVVKIYKNPSVLKDIPQSIKDQIKDLIQLSKDSPSQAIVQVGSDIFLLNGGNKILDKLRGATERELTKTGAFGKYLGDAKAGSNIKIKLGGKNYNLKVVNKIPTEKLSKQIKKAGKNINIAISSQGDKLISLIRDQKILRKPIPNEASLSKETKKLLNKFDKGTINKRELIKLDKGIQKIGTKGILERSFFADPTGKIRPSRLGIVKEEKAKLKDFLSGNVTFKKKKPQLLLFKDVKLQNFPKTKTFKKIINKLKRGIKLSNKETAEYLKFQFKRTGKFKPVGFATEESEILLAPKEIIKKDKKIGNIIVKGKRVPIYQTSVYKPKGKIKTLLKKLEKSKITKKELKKLDKLLDKETGFNYKFSKTSYKNKSPKYVNAKGLILSALSKTSFKKRGSKVTSYKRAVSKRTGYSKKTYAKSKIRKGGSNRRGGGYPNRITPKPPRSPVRYKPPKPPVRTPPKPIPRYKPKFNSKRKTRFIPSFTEKLRKNTSPKKAGYFVYEKRGSKFYKIQGQPLTFKDAKDRLAYRLDNKLSRTAKIKAVFGVKRLGSLQQKERSYFKRTKYKYRPYRIIRKKKIPISLSYIEKRKYSLDKTGEKRQLSLNQLKNLARGRRIMMMNRKRRKR